MENTSDTVLVTEYPGFKEASFDCATMPAETRLHFLKAGVRSYIANRLNQAVQRHSKLPAAAAWRAYEEATTADPLQSVVPKPTDPKPVLDLESAYAAAVADLTAGKLRKHGDGPKPRPVKDPLIALVTQVVVSEVFARNRESNPKFSFLEAKKIVGVDGVAYLNNLIEAKVAAGADRAQLEKYRDTRYIQPAKLQLGITSNKSLADLPTLI